ncbi:S1 RNA-binding domain-containing protein [Tepidiforma flava]|uniref:S1 RNA-binding domain-containing protein n=1 Tax=Tepidiforma flava TaxID=3004094 RepID=A0ABY7M8F1_9CHLR|nr:S1 RNA-binding domain-containing protein [Tepidiforma flava]WBL36817.1 S1 RNA-binding domain-containing protein [Tepidiforma flava]
MYKLKIPQDMIGTLIGPGGKTVRRIQDEAGGATIDIQEDGTVIVGSPNEEVARKAIRMIEGLTKEVQVGEIYTGKVTRLLNFGAFVEILGPARKALVHISQLGADHVRNVEDEVKVGDEVHRHGLRDRQPRPHQHSPAAPSSSANRPSRRPRRPATAPATAAARGGSGAKTAPCSAGV